MDIEGPKKSLKQLWKINDFEAKSAPFVYDGILYISTKGTLLAINAEIGSNLWEYEIPGKATIPVFKNDQLFFGGNDIDNYLYALDRNSGKEIWKYRSGSHNSPIHRTPIVNKDSLIFLAGKTIHNVDIITGKAQWRFNLKKRVAYYSIAFANNKIYVVTSEGYDKQILHCIDFEKRELLWKIKVPKIGSDPVYANGILYFLNRDAELCEVNPETGALKKSKIIDQKKEARSLYLTYSDGVLFLVCDYNILALNLSSKTWLWNFHSSTIIGRPVITKDIVYFGSMGNGIFALDIKSGKKIFNEVSEVRSKFACGLYNHKLFYAGSMNEHQLIAYSER